MKPEEIKTIACVNEYIHSGKRNIKMEELELSQDRADIFVDGICLTRVARKGCDLDIGDDQKAKIANAFFESYGKGSLPSDGYQLYERQFTKEGSPEIINTFCMRAIFFVFMIECTYLELIRIYFSNEYNISEKEQEFANALKNACLGENAGEQFKEKYLDNVRREANIYALAEFLEYWKRIWNRYNGGTF